MKKAISIIIASVLLVCMILPLAVSADGSVLWTEDFSSVKENDWIWDGDLFFIENGRLEGWAEAVVHQSNFLVDRGAPRRYKECAFKIEACGLEDGGRDADSHYLGLWFADYISPYGSDDADGQIVYTWGYEFETRTVRLGASFGDAGEDFKPADYDDTKPVFEFVIPESEAPVMDVSGSGKFTIGMRLSGGVVSCFLNDKKYVDFPAYRGAVSFTQLASPVILWNTNCHCTFDNLVVSTADYNLFNESSNPAPAPVPSVTETEKVIETKKVVVGTDAEGNEITEIVTEEVVRVAASTGNGNSVGTASATGDMALIVAAVMIVALGAALVVKKVTSKN
jgi:hypothetical protein